MNTANSGRTFHILLAEDSQEDFFLLQTCFNGLSHPVILHQVENGQDCLDFLCRTGRYESMPAPDLLFLDLNMPKLDGREVMARIAADPGLRRLPVLVLTTSANREDICTMYELGCSAYVVKPLEFPQFMDMVRTIADYWFSVVTLPDSRG